MFLTSTVSQSIRKTVTGTRYSKHGVVSKADAPLPPRPKTVGFHGDFHDIRDRIEKCGLKIFGGKK